MPLEEIYQLILNYKYPLLLLVAIIEGPIISIFCGFLLRLGELSFWPTYLVLILADLIGDVVLYSAGYFWGQGFINRFGRFFGITEGRIEAVKKIFHKHKNKILFISKVTMGLGFGVITLITAGLVKIPFKRYMTINMTGQFVWSGLLLIFGYFFGHLYNSIENGFARLTFLVIFILVVIVIFNIAKQIRERRLKKADNLENIS